MNIPLTDTTGLIIIFSGLLLGAMLKGATGAGLPIIAVPVIAAFYDIRFAVVLLVIPNLITNVWQIVKYREHNTVPSLMRRFAIYGAIGAACGTVLLAQLPLQVLDIFIALIVLLYVALRLGRPNFQLPVLLATKLAVLAGASGGLLQGAIGLSAPVAITFLNAIKLPRPTFIFTVSVFFAAMCLIQIPVQIMFGLMTWQMALLGLLALLPIFLGLPIGERIGKRMSPAVFDKTLLIVLSLLAIKMLIDAV